MKVAVLTAEHVECYRALMIEAYSEATDVFTSTPEERAAEPVSWWIRRIADPGGLTVAFGAFQEQELVGTVALEFSAKPKTRHRARLIGMYIRPGARGVGAGRGLIDAALEHLRQMPEIACVTLTVTQGNDSAFNLYRKAGFIEFGTEPMAIKTADGYKSKVHMWLELGSRHAAG